MNARTRFLAFGFWFLAFGFLFAQNSRFELFLRSTSNTAVTGATVYVVHMTTGDSLLLSEVSGKNGYYRRDNVEFGNYKIYVNGSLSTTQKFHPTDRIYLTLTGIDADGDYLIEAGSFENSAIVSADIANGTIATVDIADNAIDSTKIANSAVTTEKIDNETILAVDMADSIITLQKMTTATINYINSGGSVTNNPDDNSTENKSGSTIGIKDSYFYAADTNAIKNLSPSTTINYVYLDSTSSSNPSGGFYAYRASGYTARRFVAYAASGGGHWVRKDWIDNPGKFYYSWVSATKTGTTAATIVNTILQSGETLILDEGVYSGTLSFAWTNAADSLTVQGAGVDKTIFTGSFIVTSGKTFTIKDLTFDRYETVTPTDVAITGWSDGARFEMRNVHLRGNGGDHHILSSGDVDVVFINCRASGKTGTSSAFAIRGCRSFFGLNLDADSSDFGVTIKSADTDEPINNFVLSNFHYTGDGSAIFFQSNDNRPVNNVVITNVTVDSGATRIVHSSTYDEGVPEYNGIIKNVTISDVTAPYLTGSAFTLDGIENIKISNVVIDTCAGYGFNVANGTGVLNWTANDVTIRGAGSGVVSAYTGAVFTNINGEVRQTGSLIYSAEGVHPNEEFSNGVAEGVIVDLAPLDSAAGSWRPGLEIRQPAVEANKNSQNTRLLTGGYRTTTGGTYFGTGVRNALVANNNANNPNNLWEQFSFNTYYHWGIGHDTTDYILYTDSYTKNIGIGNSTGFDKTHTKLTIYDSNPRMVLTDSDVNLNVTSAAQAADTQAVYIWAHGSTPSVQLTDANGNDLVIQPVVSASANAGGGASVPATVSGFLVFTWNGTTYKIPYFAN